MQRRVRVTVLAGGIAAAIVSAVAAVVLSPPPARLLTSVVVLLGVGFALGRVLWPRLVWVTRAGSVLVRVGGSVLFRPGGIEAYRYLRARRVPRIGRPVPLTRPYLVPLELPPPGLLIGRDAELQDVLDYAEQPAAGPRVVVIHGPAGIGKTTLAIKAAHLMAARYADGVLFASLAGFTLPASGARPDAAADPPDPPGEELTGTVLGAFVESLQGPGDRVPYGNAARLDRFRELTATTKQRVLIVLDDAPGVDAVLPLIPAGPAGAVLITSRDPLPELEPQLSLSLGPLGDTAATHLLKMVVGAERIEREETAAHAIVERADGHPLALQLAAGSLASRGGWTLSATVERMSQFRRPLIGAGGSPFAGALDLSYALLTEEERRAVRLLGLLDDRTFAPWMLAALLEATEKTAWRVSARLVHARLLEDVTDDATGVTAFRVLEHVQRYARARLYAEASEQECQAARRRQRSAERMRGEHSPRTTLRHIVYPELERGLLSRALNHARGALAQSRENLAAAQGALGEGSRLTRARLVDLQESKGLALAALAEVLAELGGV
ncbi:MAG TPA: AAA family ATPase, partial [Micromonosporaceae bacterium]|nr:AAA family ATPase [Micromonosporaceae bacterium]